MPRTNPSIFICRKGSSADQREEFIDLFQEIRTMYVEYNVKKKYMKQRKVKYMPNKSWWKKKTRNKDTLYIVLYKHKV